MEKKTSQKIRLGVFVITGLIIFVLAIYFIGSKQSMFGNTERLAAVFTNVNGLQQGNNVRYSGINVGTVESLKMANDTTIRVEMIIDKKIFKHIKKDAKASISSDGLVGSMIINITPGQGKAPVVRPGDVIESVERVRTEELLNTLSITNENAAAVTKDLLNITNEITQGRGTIGALLKDDVMADDLRETMNYLKMTGKSTSESVASLNRLISSLNQKGTVVGVLKDSAVANKIKSIVNNLDQSGEQIDRIVTNLNGTVLNIKEGKGAINYLSNDPKLVRQIDSTMSNVNDASKNLNQNLEALKHNFLFRGYFRKQERAKQKREGK